MSSDWLPVVAALGASGLTAFATYGIDRLREGRTARGARKSVKVELYAELLTASAELVQGFGKLRIMTDAMSKPGHALRQMFKTEPPQPSYMEIFATLQQPMSRLMDAWSRSLLVFDQEEIGAVNDLMFASQQFDLSKLPSEIGSVEALIGTARIAFAAFARTKLGEDAVRIAYEPPNKDDQTAPVAAGDL